MRQAAADRYLHVGIAALAWRQVAEVAVQLVVGVLADRTGVEDDDVGVSSVGRAAVTGRFEQPSKPFRIVDVHLAAVGAYLVGAYRIGGHHSIGSSAHSARRA